jgi:signal transduction histidine kinase
MADESGRDRGISRRVPAWFGNLLVFSALLLMVVSYFFFQTSKAQDVFLEDAKYHTRLLAEAVRLNARGALLSSGVIDAILKTFLANSASFVKYLDAVEPFSTQELTAFAEEVGLSCIRIVRADGTVTQGPSDWCPEEDMQCPTPRQLMHFPSSHMTLFATPVLDGDGCVLVGIDTRQIDKLQEEIGLAQVLKTAEGLPGMKYVHLRNEEALDRETVLADQFRSTSSPAVSLKEQQCLPIAEVRLRLGGAELVVGADARPLFILQQRLWRDFFWFAATLVTTGVFLSWLLYRWQTSHLEEVQAYERRLSKQREEAALGRAAAAIAHEIRNPLNTIGMGIQRLQIEAQELSREHYELIGIVLDALKRTNSTVTGLLNYSRPPRPKMRPIRLDRLLDDILILYQKRLDQLGIEVYRKVSFDREIQGDPDFLRQVIDNLLRNAVEAQPEGGYVDIAIEEKGDFTELRVRNGGFSLPAEDAELILAPYFTTKTRGTGLGLAISERLVKAHGGRIEVSLPLEDALEIRVYLPKQDRPSSNA